MKKFLLFMLFILFGINGAYATAPKFSVTTINMSAGAVFGFGMSASGTFTVDCGDGGVLSGDGVSGNIIDRTSNTTYAKYACTYSTGGVKTIGFDGLATGYNSGARTVWGNEYSAITFNDNDYIASLSGDLSALFPYFGSELNQFPQYQYTFYHCSNLESIPATLFSGYTVGEHAMFATAFMYCGKLKEIPAGLFKNITSGSFATFHRMFEGCTSLTFIPPDLFKNITYAADNLFSGIFNDCINLSGYVPPSAFAGMFASGSLDYYQTTWNGAFTNTNLDTSCPLGTEQVITGCESIWANNAGRAVVSCETGIASTSYVQGMYEAINNSKMAKLNPDSIEFTPDSSPYGFFTAVEGAGDKFRFKREEITLPVGSYENPTGRMSIWLE